MTSRFLLEEAPDPKAAHTLETQLTLLHDGLLPVIESNRSEMLGWCAPMRLVTAQNT